MTLFRILLYNIELVTYIYIHIYIHTYIYYLITLFIDSISVTIFDSCIYGYCEVYFVQLCFSGTDMTQVMTLLNPCCHFESPG